MINSGLLSLRALQCIVASTALLLGSGQVVNAGTQNAIKSCYEMMSIASTPSVVDVELFILVDRTTALDDRLKQVVWLNVEKFVSPGNAFTLVAFSAYIQNHFTEIEVAGKLDSPMPKKARDNVSKKKLKDLDACLAAQIGYARKLVNNALQRSYGLATLNISKSDILASLADIAENAIKPSIATRRLVLIISDMLENSSVTSFYAKNAVRQLDPSGEMKKIEAAQLLTDFGGAEIYVIGAGTIAIDPKGAVAQSYRSAAVMKPLRVFWDRYFQASNGKLIEFGQPALLREMK